MVSTKQQPALQFSSCGAAPNLHSAPRLRSCICSLPCPPGANIRQIVGSVFVLLAAFLGVVAALGIVVLCTVRKRGGLLKSGLLRMLAFIAAIYTSVQTVVQVTRNSDEIPNATPAAVAAVFASLRVLHFEGFSPTPLSCTPISPLLVPTVLMACALASSVVWGVAVLIWWIRLPATTLPSGNVVMVLVRRAVACFQRPIWRHFGRLGQLAAIAVIVMYPIVCNR